MRWPWTKSEQPTALTLPVTDPLVAQWLSPFGGAEPNGRMVNASSILSTSSVYRAVSLVSSTLASLPLHSLRDKGQGETEKVSSIFDDPDGPDWQTQFEWEETLFIHLMIFGRAGALKVRNAAGGLVRLPLVHPGSFVLEDPTQEELDGNPDRMPRGGVWFRVQLDNGRSVKLDADDFWYVPAMSMDGQRGMGLLDFAAHSLGAVQAGDRAASRMMSNGAMISGLATPEDDFDPEELPEAKRQLNASIGGPENAGMIALVNRRLKFQPWTMTASDAQFIQQRQFSIEEVSRWSGVPPHLLMQTEKQTSWGTGVEEQNRALGRTVLAPWANRLEGRGSRLLANPRSLRIDFSGLERPSPDKEIELLLKQTGGKPILTQNEARQRLNLPPVEGGDVLNAPAPAPVTPAEDDPPGGPDDPPTE